jgi:hypothetical protein
MSGECMRFAYEVKKKSQKVAKKFFLPYIYYMSQKPPTTVRFEPDLQKWIERLMKISNLSASQVIQAACRAGLPMLESGEYNPFRVEERPVTPEPEGNAQAPQAPAPAPIARKPARYSTPRK